jgi:hypothetical protein
MPAFSDAAPTTVTNAGRGGGGGSAGFSQAINRTLNANKLILRKHILRELIVCKLIFCIIFIFFISKDRSLILTASTANVL